MSSSSLVQNAIIQCVTYVQRSLKKIWIYIKNMMDIVHLNKVSLKVFEDCNCVPESCFQ